MNLYTTKIAIYIGFLTVLFSCKRDQCQEKIPSLVFKSFTVFDSTKANVIVEFYDCDSDIGLDEADTTGTFQINGENYYNYFMYYWEKRGGVWVKWADLSPAFYYRIPRINSDNSLKGEIEIKMEPYYFVPTSVYDTIKFEIVLVDRALNKSNAVFTPEIIKP